MIHDIKFYVKVLKCLITDMCHSRSVSVPFYCWISFCNKSQTAGNTEN